MSQSSSIFNANSNSGFFQSIKSRKSASSQSGCKLLYNQEVNYCPSCRTKIETFASNSAQYGAKMVFELPNFGHLSECFLKVKWLAGVVASEATNRNLLIENAITHLCQTIKLIVDGVEVCRTTPEAILSEFYKHATDEEKRCYQELTGGYKTRSALTKFSASTNVNSVLFPEARSANTSGCTYYLPLNFWFSALNEQMNRAIPLGVLERVFIEIECSDAEYINIAAGSSSSIGLDKMSIVSYLTELDPAEESMYRASSFEAGGQPLSVLGKSIIQHIEPNVAHSTGTATSASIKLNMFSGQISKLYVMLLDQADDNNLISTAINTTKSHFNPLLLSKLSLHANGVEIYKMNELDQRENKLENWINRDFGNAITVTASDAFSGGAGGWSKVQTSTGQTTSTADNIAVTFSTTTTEGEFAAAYEACQANNVYSKSFDTSSINPDHIYVINFKNVGGDQRSTSMTGSINFSNLSVPTINYTIPNSQATGAYKVVVVAHQHNLITYSTNNAGRVALRSVS